MPLGINTCIKWSILELRGLLENEDTRVYFHKAKRHIGLHPFHLNDLNRALREILNSNVNAYDAELQGLVLAYKNPKLISSLGAILHDSYFIHVDVEADFYIFKPEIGCVLKGIANKKATNHVGVLVHKAFNVSIPKPDDCDEWLGDYVFVGQKVKFKVTHLDFKGKLPFVKGKLISDGICHSTYYTEDSVVKSDQEDKKQTFISGMVNVSSHNGFDFESMKKRSHKSRVTDNIGDEMNEEDNNRKVCRKQELKSRSKKHDELPREVECNEAHKWHQGSTVSDESEDGTRRKKKTKGSPKMVSKENASSDTSIEQQESADRKPKAGSFNVTKFSVTAAKKKKAERSKDDGYSNISIEREESADRKPRINESLKVEKKNAKNKHKKVYTTSNPPSDLEHQDIKFVVGRTCPANDIEDCGVSENAALSKKCRVTKVKIKSEIRVKKKRNKEHKEEVDKSDLDGETADNNTQNIRTFKFIKPKIKPKHKTKLHNIIDNNESGDAAQSIVVENDEVTSVVLRDIKIKVEPDPSDIEDTAPREKSVKKKRKHSTIKQEITREDNESDDKTFLRNVEIKTEQDVSDIEDAKPSKKKSKKRNSETDVCEDIQIKVELNALSDGEN